MAATPKRRAEAARAASSGQRPAAGAVRASARKKNPMAMPDVRAIARPARLPRPPDPPSATPSGACWLTSPIETRARAMPASVTTTGTLAGQQPRRHRDRHRTDSRHGRDERHRTHGQRPVEQRHANAARQARHSPPSHVGTRSGGVGKKRQRNRQQRQPRRLRHRDDSRRCGPTGRHPADEVGRAVERRRREGEEKRHRASLSRRAVPCRDRRRRQRDAVRGNPVHPGRPETTGGLHPGRKIR